MLFEFAIRVPLALCGHSACVFGLAEREMRLPWIIHPSQVYLDHSSIASLSKQQMSAIPLSRETATKMEDVESTGLNVLLNQYANMKLEDVDDTHVSMITTKLTDPLLLALLAIPNICIAGGFILTTELNWLHNTHESDVDFWVYASDDRDRRRAALEFESVLRKSTGELITQSLGLSVLTFYVPDFKRKIQLIFVDAATPEDVIRRFDLDVCKAAYVMTSQKTIEMRATKKALVMWETKRITVAQDKWTGPTKVRLDKYRGRGFDVISENGVKWTGLTREERFLWANASAGPFVSLANVRSTIGKMVPINRRDTKRRSYPPLQ